MTTKIIVHGAAGRMGRNIISLADAYDEIRIVAAMVRQGSRLTGQNCPENKAISYVEELDDEHHCDVLIDFSSDEGTQHALQAAKKFSRAFLTGTTALSENTLHMMRQLAKTKPVLAAPNTSRGISLMRKFMAHLAESARDADISIVEAHRREKKDAPSGTALLLAQVIRAAGAEIKKENIFSLRGGDVAGEHTVRFALPGEYLEITHRATGPEVFAHGALRAAVRLHHLPPGLYAMEDVL